MSVRVSVVIPIYNGGEEFRQCVEHLGRSTSLPFEVIVVDDGSTDGAALYAADGIGATILRTKHPKSGPAKARNIGAQHAKGDVLYFIDADVCVQPDSIRLVAEAFQEDPVLAALIGSYDDDPACQDFLSQYKNLMHAFVHQTGKERAGTFWSGCGAIRREVFLAHAGFDESYERPAIEDIELGYRLVQAGRKMILNKDLKVKHLKQWTFWKLVRTDVLDRGIPWTELILRDRNMPNDLNLQLSQRVSVALACLCFLIAMGTAIYWKGYVLTPLLALLLFALARYWVGGNGDAQISQNGFWFMTVGMAALCLLSWQYHMLGIVPPVVLGYVLLFLRHRYAIEDEKRSRFVSILLVLYSAVSTMTILTYLPTNAFTLGLAVLMLALVILNNQFYLFLAAKRGKAFAAAAIPFHLLYHFYNGISFTVGLVRFGFRTFAARKRREAVSAE